MEKTILIVEEDLPKLKSLEMLFSREGFRTLTARNTDEALKILEEEETGEVISDTDA